MLAFSTRPLAVDEIAGVIAIDPTRDPAFDRDEVLEDPLELLNICSSLVSCISHSDPPRDLKFSEKSILKENSSKAPMVPQSVVLAHDFVREYLMSDGFGRGNAKKYSMQKAECHKTLAGASLSYPIQLSHHPLTLGMLRMCPSVWCSAVNSHKHLKMAGDDVEETMALALKLLSVDNEFYFTWIRKYESGDDWARRCLSRSRGGIGPPLYYAALLGLTLITELLIDSGADVSEQSDPGDHALQAAAIGGQAEVVEILLSIGADVNAKSVQYGRALLVAFEHGHDQVAKILLAAGADVNVQGPRDSAVHVPISQGHEYKVKMLLDSGVE